MFTGILSWVRLPRKKYIVSVIVIMLIPYMAQAQQTGHIQITCSGGIKIFLDGQFKGITGNNIGGLILEDIPTGSHIIQAITEGFKSQERAVYLNPGQVLEVTIEPFEPNVEIREEGEESAGGLERKVGTAVIQSLPIDCKITIPALKIRNIPKTKDRWSAQSIPEGIYGAIVENENNRFEFDVPIVANETTFVMANLISGKIEIKGNKNPSVILIKTGKTPNGFAFEIGVGHNQLFWNWPAGVGWDGEPYASGSYDRTLISINPTVRVLYDISLSEIYYLRPFLGYDRFGGRGEQDEDGYKDSWSWDTIEFGAIISYKLGKYRVDCGPKINRHITVIHSWHSWLSYNPWGDSIRQNAGQHNWTGEFPKYSYDLGLRIGRVSKHIYYHIEVWFGISNLVKDSFFDEVAGVKARENHFRLVLGYKL